MNANPRQTQIMEALRKDNAIMVRDLAAILNVSESTVRRDLEEMENQGLVRRVFGGVILSSEMAQEPSFKTRQITHSNEKDCIGKAVSAWVNDGDVIFIDGGTTTSFILPYLLNHKDITIITCGVNIASSLPPENTNITMILVGGVIHAETQSITGPMALESLRIYGLRCNKAIIACTAVSAELGATNRTLERIPLKRLAMEISKETAIVADGSKIGRTALGHICPANAFQVLFTDSSAPQDEIQKLENLGVKVVLADTNSSVEEVASTH